MKSILLALILTLPGLLQAQEKEWGSDGIHRFYGYAYDLKSNKYLYTEVHEQVVSGGRWTRGSIGYLAPNGSSLGRKTLDFSADPTVPLYRLDSSDGYVEGITANRDRVTVIRREKSGEELESKDLPKQGLLAADSGFHSFLVGHFDALLRKEKVRFRFIAAGQLDSYKFRAQRIADGVFEGKPVVRFRVEMDSMLNLLAGPLEVSYDPKLRKLLEYRGISNIHDPTTGDAYPAVRIAYYSVPPPEAPKLPPLN